MEAAAESSTNMETNTPSASDNVSLYLPPEELDTKIEVVISKDGDDCATVILFNEDHTMGNALRYMIMKNPCVEFCGYSVPHPSEKKIHIRIQTKDGSPAVACFRKALKQIMDCCDHLNDTLDGAVKDFKASQ
eukprot:Nk52_evm20s307 gene=Nk52_evmTU20s307